VPVPTSSRPSSAVISVESIVNKLRSYGEQSRAVEKLLPLGLNEIFYRIRAEDPKPKSSSNGAREGENHEKISRAFSNRTRSWSNNLRASGCRAGHRQTMTPYRKADNARSCSGEDLMSNSSGEIQMPSSTVRTFTDPDAYAAAFRAGTHELTITKRGQFAAKITKIDLHQLWMQRCSDNLPGISDITGLSGRAFFLFRTQPGPNLLSSGVELLPTSIVRYSEGQSHYRRSAGFASYGGMSMPVAEMVSVGAAMAGRDLTSPKDPLALTPLPAAMTRLQRLHAAAGDLARRAPEIIANLDAARGLEQALIESLVGCLGEGEVREDRTALRHHSLIMRRFRRVMEEKPFEPLYMTEICKVIGVSYRTLHACCREHLGMGPKRYLLLRRMHLARRALREATPDTTSVTDVATRYGFWQFGRFAGEYRALFGEAPSASLRQ